MEIKYCFNCGAKLQEGALFCGECGAKIPVEPTPVNNVYEESEPMVEEVQPELEVEEVQAEPMVDEVQPELEVDEIQPEITEEEPPKIPTEDYQSEQSKKSSILAKKKLLIGIGAGAVAVILAIVSVVVFVSNSLKIDGKYYLRGGNVIIDFNDSNGTFKFKGDENSSDDKGTFTLDKDKKEVTLTYDSDGTTTSYKTDGDFIYSNEYSGECEAKKKNQTVRFVDSAGGTSENITITITIKFYSDGTYEKTSESYCPDNSYYNTSSTEEGSYTIEETGVIGMIVTKDLSSSYGIVRDGRFYETVYQSEKTL